MMGWPKRLSNLAVAMLWAGGMALAGQNPAGKLTLLDLSGRHVNPLRATHAKATVFVFTRSDCPISNRYAPEVRRLYKKFAPRGVTFWLVYPDPNEALGMIRQHLKEYQYPFGALRDPTHALVTLTGAKVTPEAAVFVHDGKMVYHGRIDDLYVDFGRTRRAPTARDLEQALEAVLEGKPVKEASTPAVGCFISDLK
jgi:peroxiredoxin